MMLTINWQLSALAIPFALLYVLTSPYFEPKARRCGKVMTNLRVKLGRDVYEGISALSECRATASERWGIRKITTPQKGYMRSAVITWFYGHMRESAKQLTNYIGAIAMFVFGFILLRQDAISVGEIVAFTLIFMEVMNRFTEFISLYYRQKELLYQANRVYQFHQQPPHVTEAQNPVVLPKIDGAISLRDVRFMYNGSKPVLNGINLDIRPGEKVAFVGPSGQGKTTLLKLIGRLYDPDHGMITWDSVPLPTLSLSQLRDSCGYVFQETYLFGTTIRENIRFGKPDATDAQIEAAAKAANAHAFITQLTDGYDTVVGERGVKLSGGQKQRIAIARLFIKQPAVILLDEATSALDNISEANVKASLDLLLKGKTVIAIAHRLSTIVHYDNIVFIAGGTIVEQGNYDELMTKQGEFWRYMQTSTATEGVQE